MSTSDRELLEFAAKAIGLNIKGYRVDIDDSFTHLVIGKKNTRERVNWNPLTDDGDALRLAVKLHISVEHPDPADMGGGYVTARICKTRYKRLYLKRYWFNVDTCEGDAYATTRRAIVRAAAEIGKAMK